MKTPGWIRAQDTADGKPIPHSGGEGQQFKGGYDATDRPTTKANGALITPRILNRNPSRLREKEPVPVSTDAMPPRLPHSGSQIATRKMRPNEKPPSRTRF